MGIIDLKHWKNPFKEVIGTPIDLANEFSNINSLQCFVYAHVLFLHKTTILQAWLKSNLSVIPFNVAEYHLEI